MNQFQTFKSDLTKSRIINADLPIIEDGEILLKIESFALRLITLPTELLETQLDTGNFFQLHKMVTTVGVAYPCGDLQK